MNWVGPSLGDLNRLVNAVEQGIHANCAMHLTVHLSEVHAHLEHTCGMIPELVPMTGPDDE
jgi:hypothetical protein